MISLRQVVTNRATFAQLGRCGWRSLQIRRFYTSPMAGSNTHPAKKLKTGEAKKVIRPRPHSVIASLTFFAPILQVIGTHNGTFHCDEALAVHLLKQTSTYANAGLPHHPGYAPYITHTVEQT